MAPRNVDQDYQLYSTSDSKQRHHEGHAHGNATTSSHNYDHTSRQSSHMRFRSLAHAEGIYASRHTQQDGRNLRAAAVEMLVFRSI